MKFLNYSLLNVTALGSILNWSMGVYYVPSHKILLKNAPGMISYTEMQIISINIYLCLEIKAILAPANLLQLDSKAGMVIVEWYQMVLHHTSLWSLFSLSLLNITDIVRNIRVKFGGVLCPIGAVPSPKNTVEIGYFNFIKTKLNHWEMHPVWYLIPKCKQFQLIFTFVWK